MYATGRCSPDTLDRHAIDAVIHLAGKKNVSKSVADPLHYCDANLGGGVPLLQALQERAVPNQVFSPSAAVYGRTGSGTEDEKTTVQPNNPYGRTNLIIEDIFSDAVSTGAISLRYFNTIGAHPSE